MTGVLEWLDQLVLNITTRNANLEQQRRNPSVSSAFLVKDANGRFPTLRMTTKC